MFAAWLLLLTSSPFAYADSPEKNSLPQGTPVTVVKAVQASMTESTVVRGQIESPDAPHIAAKVSAEIVSIKVDEGMEVQAGQLLAELDDEIYKIAEEKANSAIQRLEALIENQQRELKRRKDLAAKKVASQSVLDEARTALKLSQAELIGAKATLKEARYQLSHTQITSPVDGVIQERSISKGDYVVPGSPLFHIASTKTLRARLYFPETLTSSIHLGTIVKLTKDNKTITSKVSRMRPMLEDGNRALHALVDFQNEDGWKPGSSIVAQVILNQQKQAVAVPERALVRRPAGIVVYRVKGTIVEEQSVTTGIKKDELIEITSGLVAGDIIVNDGAFWLTDSATISIREAGE